MELAPPLTSLTVINNVGRELANSVMSDGSFHPPNAFGQPALTPEQVKKLNEFFEKEKIPRIRSHNSGLVIFSV